MAVSVSFNKDSVTVTERFGGLTKKSTITRGDDTMIVTDEKGKVIRKETIHEDKNADYKAGKVNSIELAARHAVESELTFQILQRVDHLLGKNAPKPYHEFGPKMYWQNETKPRRSRMPNTNYPMQRAFYSASVHRNEKAIESLSKARTELYMLSGEVNLIPKLIAAREDINSHMNLFQRLLKYFKNLTAIRQIA